MPRRPRRDEGNQASQTGAGDAELPVTGAGDAELPVTEPASDGTGPETTGRFIVVFKDEAAADAAAIRSILDRDAGLRNVVASADYEGGAVAAEDMAQSEVVHFNKL